MWAWVSNGDCGFGWNLFGGSNVLSASAFVFCSTMEIDIILRCSILDKLSPGRPDCCLFFVPSLKAYVALLEVSFDVIFEPFLLATWGTLSLNKL